MTDPRKDAKAMRGAVNRRAEARAVVRDQIALAVLALTLEKGAPREIPPSQIGAYAQGLGRSCYLFADEFLAARGDQP